MKPGKIPFGLLLLNAAFLLVLFTLGFLPENPGVRLFQGGAFTLACFDIAYIVRTVFADRLKKD